MSTFDQKLIHTRRLFREEQVSLEKGKRVMRDLERKGLVDPQITPSGWEFVSPNEALVFHEAVQA